MQCPKCGRVLKQGQRFCTGCGTALASKNSSPQKTVATKSGGGQQAEQPQTAPEVKRKTKPGTSKEIPDWNPPAVSTQPRTERETRMESSLKSKGFRIWKTLGGPWRRIPFLDEKLSDNAKSAVSTVLILIVVLILVFFINTGDGAREEQAYAEYLPPGSRIIDENIADNDNEAKIEVQIEVESSVQEEDVKKLLKSLFEYKKTRFESENHREPTDITIYAYASENIYKQDPTWWIGRLFWVKGLEPKTELNMDAVLPRHKALGYGGLTREEYLVQSDAVAREIGGAMNYMRKLFRDYEKLLIDDKVFREKGATYSDILFENTEELPAAPWNDCVDLEAAFLALVEATYYFQDILAPESGIFEEERFNTEEFYENLNNYASFSAVYHAERKKYE